MNEFLNSLKREATDNPTAAMAVAAGLIASIGKLVTAYSEGAGSRAYARYTNQKTRSLKNRK